MKLNSLKSEFLKYMIKSYAKDHKRVFAFESFKYLYPELDDDFISDALFALDEDGFVHVYKADDIAYEATLLPNFDGLLPSAFITIQLPRPFVGLIFAPPLNSGNVMYLDFSIDFFTASCIFISLTSLSLAC